MAEPSLELDEGRRGLDELGDEVADVGDWELAADGAWSLALTLVPHGLETGGPIPARTRWRVVVFSSYPFGTVYIRPAKDGGITETFPHQSPNDAGDPQLPWRSGQLCLTVSPTGIDRLIARHEPQTAYHKIAWNAALALEWLRRASRDQLIAAGEPFELPIFPRTDIPTVAYLEGLETFANWQATGATEGFVEMGIVSGAEAKPKVVAALRWADINGNTVVTQDWGLDVASRPVWTVGVWFRFDRLLALPPFRAPQTWGEVFEFARRNDPHFEDRLRKVAARIREGRNCFGLFGFPIPKVQGDAPNLMAWVALILPPLKPLSLRRRSNPKAEEAVWQHDRTDGPLADDQKIAWLRAENWHPDELATRGRFESLTGKKVLLIGAGALGSIFAETLVRGGVHDITIIDYDRLVAGNLVRHRLSISDAGFAKATVLALRLNEISPSARVVGIDEGFSPYIVRQGRIVRDADIVIDTTGSSPLLAQLAGDYWRRPRVFLSISLSYGAEKFYFYLARGDRFPADRFKIEIDPWLKADARPAEDFLLEGTGCFDPVFPARIDDIELFSAIAARQLDGRLGEPLEHPSLTVFARRPNGTVEIETCPPSGDE